MLERALVLERRARCSGQMREDGSQVILNREIGAGFQDRINEHSRFHDRLLN
jgi:hypothetical protein